jgi:hypothetical protein
MVNKDQAILIFQMILAQHSDKTWGDICEMFGLIANVKDKNIKIKDSYIDILGDGEPYECEYVINADGASEYLIGYDGLFGDFVCYGIKENGRSLQKKILLEKLLSIVSFEDKV